MTDSDRKPLDNADLQKAIRDGLNSGDALPAERVFAELQERYGSKRASSAAPGPAADLDELLDGITAENVHQEADFGRPSGDEEL